MNDKTKPRFKLVEKSVSAHCCFEATVLDTKTKESVCETFSLEYAKMVLEALNKEYKNE
jgi:hypothetical protein